MSDVCIVGATAAGVAAAVGAQEAGADVVVVDRGRHDATLQEDVRMEGQVLHA